MRTASFVQRGFGAILVSLFPAWVGCSQEAQPKQEDVRTDARRADSLFRELLYEHVAPLAEATIRSPRDWEALSARCAAARERLDELVAFFERPAEGEGWTTTTPEPEAPEQAEFGPPEGPVESSEAPSHPDAIQRREEALRSTHLPAGPQLVPSCELAGSLSDRDPARLSSELDRARQGLEELSQALAARRLQESEEGIDAVLEALCRVARESDEGPGGTKR